MHRLVALRRIGHHAARLPQEAHFEHVLGDFAAFRRIESSLAALDRLWLREG